MNNLLRELMATLEVLFTEFGTRLETWTPEAIDALTDLLRRVVKLSVFTLVVCLSISAVFEYQAFLSWAGVGYLILMARMWYNRQGLNAAGLLLATDAAIGVSKGATPINWENAKKTLSLDIDLQRLKALATLQLVLDFVVSVMLLEGLLLLFFTFVRIWPYLHLLGPLALSAFLYGLSFAPRVRTAERGTNARWVTLAVLATICGWMVYWEVMGQYAQQVISLVHWQYALAIFLAGCVVKPIRKFAIPLAIFLMVVWIYNASMAERAKYTGGGSGGGGRTVQSQLGQFGPVTLPSETEGLVRTAASRWNVPFELAATVCLHESGCRGGIQDGASGEIGPMQVMPETGQYYGVTVEQLRNVETNIDVGVHKLGDHLRQFANAPDPLYKAILAYNSTVLAEKYRDVPWSQVPQAELRGVNRYGVNYDAGRYVEEVVAAMQTGKFNGNGSVAMAAARSNVPTLNAITLPPDLRSVKTDDPRKTVILVSNKRHRPVQVSWFNYEGKEECFTCPNGISSLFGTLRLEDAAQGEVLVIRDKDTGRPLDIVRPNGQPMMPYTAN